MSPLKLGKIRAPDRETFLQSCINAGVTRAQAENYLQELLDCLVYLNETYVVHVRPLPQDMNPLNLHGLRWLSIRRQDREPVRDWRDLQEIKNQILGPEAEAVEIFPAESRLVDCANQFHLFGGLGFRAPFGFTTRAVTAQPFMNSKQREFPRSH